MRLTSARSIIGFPTVALVAATGALVASLAFAGDASAVTTTYNCTGSAQTFAVPAGVTLLTYTVNGAGGGNGGSGDTFLSTKAGGSGGAGAKYSGTWTVSPGDTVTVKVGCKGNNGSDKRDGDGGGSGGWGFFTGGNGGNAGNRNCGWLGCGKSPTGGAGGGGGASGIQIGSLSVVAGGGGGGGGGAYWSNGGGAYAAVQGAALANGSNGPKNGDGNGGSGGSGGGGGNAGGGVSGDNGGNGAQNGRSAASSAGAISSTLNASGGATGTNNGSVKLTYFSPVSITGITDSSYSRVSSPSVTLATPDASTTFECKLDGGAWAACASPYTIPTLADGVHNFSVRPKDSDSQSGPEVMRVWTVDTTAPAKPVLTGGADGLTRQTKTSIAWSGEIGGGQTATCSTDGGSFTTCPPSPVTRTGLANGSYSFAVKVTDQAGNSSTTTRSWTVNTSAPASYTGNTGGSVPANVDITTMAVTQSRYTVCAAGSYVKCWGSSYSGILGDSNITIARTSAQPAMADLRYAEMLSLAYDSACASFSGAIKCLGRNGSGQLGNGTTTDSMSSAVVVQGLSESITQLASGDSHTCGLESGGRVKCWGSNSSGQLGDGSTTTRTSAVSVSGLSGATFVGAGGNTTCAVVALGAVKCWGDNSRGGLGNGTTTNSSTPVSVSGVTDATKVFTNSGGTSCALIKGGSVKCWGSNLAGGVGNGTINTTFPYAQFTPVTVTGISTAVDLNLGYGHACAVLADGTVKCWGSNGSGQLGIGPAGTQSTPVAVSGISNAVALGRGDGLYTCALLTFGPGGVGGNVKCWGYNSDGMVGNGGTNSTSSPNKNVYEIKNTPPPAPTVAAPTATTGPTASITFKGESGATFECSLDGESWATCTSSKSLTGLTDGWHSFSVRGKSSNGTGDASTVSWVADATPPAKPTVSSTAVGTTRQTGATVTWSAALEAGETVTCSKDGGAFTTCGASPVSLSGLADGDHSFAVKAADSFGNAVTSTASWKVNGAAAASVTGDTGDPTTTSAALTGASAIALGNANGCVLISPGGTVKCWGWFKSGISPSDKVMPPTEVSGVSGATAIAVGGTNGCALIPGGTVKCWGDNYYYQLGTGTSAAFSDSAVQIAGITDATGIAVGDNYLCATLASRKVVCWGGSSSDNTRNATPVPVKYQPPNPTGPPGDWNVDATSIWTGTGGWCVLYEPDIVGVPMCWGRGRNDLPSEITYMNRSTNPATLTNYSGALQVTGFTYFPGGLCFRRASGSVECLTDSTRFAISGISGVSDISAYAQSGTWHNSGCAVVTAGAVKCWGNNHYGKLGDGTTTDSPSPVMGLDVLDLQPVSVKDLGAAAVKVAVGPSTACAILVDTHVKCWGDGTWGQLGNGTKDSSLTPIEVGGGTTTNPPPAPVIAPPSATTLPSADVTFKGEKGATFECQLDSGTWGACTSPKSLTGLSTGWHSFSVRAANSGGTGDSSTVSWIASAGSPPAKPTLTGAPTGTVKTTTASISFTSDAGATFTCSLDGGSGSACTSPRALSGLADGSHTLTVQAVKDSLTSEEASATWTVDTAAPAAPILSGAPTGSTNSKTASISFSGEPGGTFQCSLDNGSYSACTSPKSLSNLSDGSHTLRVTQTDSAGNVSAAASATWTVVTPPPADVTPPPVPTLSGKPAALTKSKSAWISFSSEPGAVFTCSVDGGRYARCTSPGAFSGLADGPHSLAVKASDSAGNTSYPASVTWSVDSTAPDKPLLSGTPSGTTSARTASLTVIAEAGAALKCSIDGGSESACTSPIELKDLADGSHSVSVKAIDPAGNESSVASASWTVDTLAPSVTLTGAPNGTVKTRSASISIATEQAATVTCSIDGGSFGACSSPVELSDLADGEHSLAVKAVDGAGNFALVQTDKWVVKATAPPAPSLFGVPSGKTSQDGATIAFTSEPGSSFRCSVDGGAYAVCGSPKVLVGLSDGSHSIAVKAVDTVGNESAETTRSWLVDSTAPAAPVVSGAPSQATTSKTATLRFTAQAGATFTCSLDGAAFRPCSSPRTLTDLSDGSHSLVVLATDAAGNVSGPGKAHWFVAKSPPPVAPPTVLTPAPGVKTLFRNGAANTWTIKVNLLFSNGDDDRTGADFLTLQVAVDSKGRPVSVKPEDGAPYPTAPSISQGIANWDPTKPTATVNWLSPPVWARVQNKSGKWSKWAKLTL